MILYAEINSNTRDAVSRHCKGVEKYDIPTKSGTQTVSFIGECIIRYTNHLIKVVTI